MKNLCIALIFLIEVLGLSPVFGQKFIKKTVFIIVDGISADALEKVNTPNLNRIASIGGYIRSHVGGDIGEYNQTPTVSAVSYNSLLTGTWVNKHHVTGNDIKEPNYNYWTLFRYFKDQYPEKKTAIFSSWLDNRTKLVGDHNPMTGDIPVDYHFDGYENDTVQFKHDKEDTYMHRIDEKVSDMASSTIERLAPDLSWVYLEWTDDMGHMHGDGPEFTQAIEYMDAQIGRIYKALEYRHSHFHEDWLIFITTDHGRDAKTGRGHGGQSPRERSTWMVTNFRPLNNYAQYFTPGIVDILPSIARFMDIKIPMERSRELDGISVLGPVSMAGLTVNYIQNHLDLSWKVLNKEGTAKIYISTTNNFKEGKPDDYRFITEVPVNNAHVSIPLIGMPSNFYKVVLEAPYNTLNKWIILNENSN